MDTNYVSELQRSESPKKGRGWTEELRHQKRKLATAHFGNYCRRQARGVKSLKHSPHIVLVIGLMASISVSIDATDHSIFTAHSWGRYEW